MTQKKEIDLGRRKFLTISTSLLGIIGLGSVIIPFLKSWNPSAKAKAAGAPVKVDISNLEEGAMIRVEWRGKPVWVVKRNKQTLDQLNLIIQQNKLQDPESEEPQQPLYAQNKFRSIRPEILVAVGICTHLGCSPTYLSEKFQVQVKGIKSGFFCPCHGSKFDMAGRVFNNVPAPLNLVIPPHMYLDENTILIGEDEGTNV